MTEEIQRCYRVLGLPPSESMDGIKRAFRRLVKEWHPDRFHHDAQQSRTGNEKLKELIPAYERLVAFHSGLFSEKLPFTPASPNEEILKTPQEQYETGYAFAQQFDYREAVAWFRRAAEKGHVRAQHNLGKMLLDGLGVNRNPEEGIEWLLRASKQDKSSTVDWNG